MSSSSGQREIYLGFDPGGDRKFGVAILEGHELQTDTVSSVEDAIEWTMKKSGFREPKAAGIDTLLHWSPGRGGLRPCDRHLREKYPGARSSVMSPNSLFGAMAVGGMALALGLRKRWPELALNETHPKVLYVALAGERYKDQKSLDDACIWLERRSKIVHINRNEHQFDAALSAWATQEGLSKSWTDIIGPSIGSGELLFPIEAVRYLWPPNLI